MLAAIFKAGGDSKEFIEAVRLAKCDACDKTWDTVVYHVGDVLGMDVLEVMHSNKQRYQCVNMLDMASGFQQLEVLRPVADAGPPTAELCLEAWQCWIPWLGLPRTIMADRETHYRGMFSL